ncbi:hypothetical protein [Actinomyces wuliandei]|uniref:hypothetical protein n=1 Tax=Actinomyces wuliandei TaxID=2057743 RepID=UPI0015D62EC7|nr:hypothetical protein [Actinomyces wuliandei]
MRPLCSPATENRPPQRWATAACWAAFCSALPSAAWRLAILTGVETGFSQTASYRGTATGTAYVLGLEALQVGSAALSLGLCSRWGEQVPRWVPGVGGRALPRLLPLVVGGTGNVVLYVVIGGTTAVLARRWLGLAQGWTPTDGMSTGQAAVLAAAYAPALVWPVALTVALIGYARR